MTRVFLIQSRFVIGGPSHQNLILAKELKQKGYNITLITGSSEKNEKSILSLDNNGDIKYFIIEEMGRDLHFYDDIISLIRLCKYIYEIKPQIVHTHTAKAGAIGRIAAKIMRVPIIIHTFHGHVFHSYFKPFKTKLFILLEKFFSLLSDKIIVISKNQYEDIVNKYRVATPNKTCIIPLGFQFETFRIKADKNELRFRKIFGFSEKDIIVASVGRLVPIKNHNMFIDCASKFKHYDKHPVKFVIVGDGELRSQLESYINQLGLNDFVTITGWVTNMAQVYQEVDLLVLTSNNEGTPVTIIEANAMGIPVVATNVGGIPDIIINGENGFLVPPNDIESMSKMLKILIEEPLVRKQMGEQGKIIAQKHFDANRLTQDIDNLYKHFLQIKGIH